VRSDAKALQNKTPITLHAKENFIATNKTFAILILMECLEMLCGECIVLYPSLLV
jgi:hypothetical protein